MCGSFSLQGWYVSIQLSTCFFKNLFSEEEVTGSSWMFNSELVKRLKPSDSFFLGGGLFFGKSSKEIAVSEMLSTKGLENQSFLKFEN